MNHRVFVSSAVAAACLSAAVVSAKLPPPSPEAKAKAAETAAKSAYASKVAAYKLCQSMDRVAAGYFAEAKKSGKQVAAPVQTPPCTEPGKFEYKPPLEASEAHSPPKTADGPPSSQATQAEQKGAKK